MQLVAVYHLTLHTFGSWPADHRRGYTVRGEGYQAPDAEEQRRREQNLSQPLVKLDEIMQRILVVGTYDVCERRGWRLHGTGNDPSHFHAAIGWKEYIHWQDVRDKLKNIVLGGFSQRGPGQ